MLSSVTIAVLTPVIIYFAGSPVTAATAIKAEQIRRKQVKDVDDLAVQMAKGLATNRSSQNVELAFKGMCPAIVSGIRAQEQPAQIVVDRWVMPTSRHRKAQLHKLRTDFDNKTGEVKRRTTRDEQHRRLDYIACPGNHTLTELGATKLPQDAPICGICEEAVVYGGRQCRPCQWTVCVACLAIGDGTTWEPEIDAEAAGSPPAEAV